MSGLINIGSCSKKPKVPESDSAPVETATASAGGGRSSETEAGTGAGTGTAPGSDASTGAGTGTPMNPDANGDGTVDETERDAWVKSLENGARGQDGIKITSYGQANDSTPDSNTLAKRGFADNLLREGSVALSPEIYNTYKPPIGSSVYVNGTLVGYYEDRTPDSYNGANYGKTIDVYDPYNRLGPVLKNAGQGKITFGPPRAQISNR